MTKFTAAHKLTAWNRMRPDSTTFIPVGEFDQTSRADRIARDMSREFGLDYTKVVDYLEARYAETYDRE